MSPFESTPLPPASDGPTYIYDLTVLRRRLRSIAELPIARLRPFFATMANDHPRFLAEVLAAGVGVFVNSPAHLELAFATGFDPERIVFASSNMSDDELLLCHRRNVNLVLDSLGQLERFGRLAGAGAEVGLRINLGMEPADGGVRHDPAYRFGITAAEGGEALRIARRHGLRIAGLHAYFGTGILDASILVNGVRRLAAAAPAFPDLRYLDAGGGLGISDSWDGDDFDLDTYARETDRVLRDLEGRLGRELDFYLEPGRYLAAPAGRFVARVIDRKVRDDRVFIGTDASVVLFPRPLLYPEEARHPCEVRDPDGRPRLAEPHPLPVYICGNSTYSQDFLARGITGLPLPEPGDAVIFHNAGAYGRSMISNFLGKGRPGEIFHEREPAAASLPRSGLAP